jgi:hypothetical protein
MRKTVFLIQCILAVMLLGSALPLCAQTKPQKTISWPELIEQCKEQEISEERIQALKRNCMDAGLADADIKKIILTLHSASSTEGHPGLLMEKVTEGLVKDVEVGVIQASIRARQSNIASAKRLVAHNYNKKKDLGKVICSVTYALESGVSSPLLTLVVQQGNRVSLGTLTSVVSATESLTLADVSPEDTQLFALQCLKKRLKPKSIRKALSAKLKS